MFEKIRQKISELISPVHIKYYIVLPTEGIPIIGLTGIALIETNRNIFANHRGLKYYVSSKNYKKLNNLTIVEVLSKLARVDILDLIFGKDLTKLNNKGLDVKVKRIY